MSSETEPIPNPIRQWREEAGLSQYALAARLNEAGHKISRTAIHYWESWARTPQLVDLERIAGLCGKTPQDAEAAFLAIHRARVSA